MALVVTNYSGVASLEAAIFRLKEDQKAQGWTTRMSSDGTTFNASGDVITSGGTGAGGFKNALAWFVLRAPDGLREWLAQNDGFALEYTINPILFSPADHFGGTPGPTTLPFAADQIVCEVSQAVDGPYDVEIGVDDASPFGWYFKADNGAGAVWSVIFLPVPSGPGTNPVVMAHDPYGFGPTLVVGPLEPSTNNVTDVLIALLTASGGGGPTDTTAPTISAFTPTTGSTITRTASIAVTVADETALRSVEIWGQLADGTRLLAYDGSAFVGIFAASSTLSSGTYTVIPDAPGWPSSTLALHVHAVDTSGNETSATGSFTFSNPPSAPAIGNFSPSDGGNTTRTGTITIDVTDDEGRTAIQDVQIAATLADGRVLTVYNGSAFPGPFNAGSARSNITNGYRYSVVYASPGWPSSTLAFRVTATDAQGRVAVDTSYNLVITDPLAAPTFGSFSPAAGAVSRTAAIGFATTSPDGFAKVVVTATLADGSSVVVYDGSSFGGEVDAGSSVSGTTTKTFSVQHDTPGWVDDYTLHVLAVGATGLSASASSAYTLTNPPAPDVVDTTAPVVSFSLPSGTKIARGDALTVDVTDETGLALIDVKVLYPTTGDYEVAYDEGGFAPRYVAKSTKTTISGGYRFKLVRTGGWPSTPTVKVRPIDMSLNQG